MRRLAIDPTRWMRGAACDLVRVILALILLVAAGLKCHQLATSPAMGDSVLDSRWVLMATVEFELLFGLWLLGNLLPRLTHRALLLCFGCFAAISLYKAITGDTSCGCFGRVEVNPWYTFTLDMAAILALLRWRPSQEGLSVSLPSRELVLRTTHVMMVWVVLGTSAAIAMRTYQPATLAGDGIVLGDDNLVVLEPEKWVGQRMPLLPFIEDDPDQFRPSQKPLRDRLADGKWIVLFYRHDCPNCLDELPKYEELGRRSVINPEEPRVALIELPPYGKFNEFTLWRNEACVLGRLNSGMDWFVQTPVQVALGQGAMVNVLPNSAR